MKNVYLFLILILTTSLNAQTPKGINYQAVLRATDGSLLKREAVTLKVTVRTNSGPAYHETINTTSNEFGVVNVVIGASGGPPDLKDKDWASGGGEIEIKIETAKGNLNLGTQSFQSVPYAFHALKADEVVNDKVEDADADPTNELQTLSYDAGTGVLSLSQGNSVTLSTSSGGDNWGTQTVQSNGTLNGDGTSANPLSVNGDLTDDQTLSLTGNQLSISGGNTVTLPTSGGGDSLWRKHATLGIYTPGYDAYIGHPDSTNVLHLSNVGIDFHEPLGQATTLLTPEILWFERDSCRSSHTCDSLEFKRGRSAYDRSVLSYNKLTFGGYGFNSSMKKSEVEVHGAGIDTYHSTVLDSNGFAATVSGFNNAQATLHPFELKVTDYDNETYVYPRGMTIKKGNRIVTLNKDKLTFSEDGLGSYALLSGNGYGALGLLNGGNWLGISATTVNSAGEISLYDISGRSNIYLGFQSMTNKSTGSFRINEDNALKLWSSSTSGHGAFLQMYGQNRSINIILSHLNNFSNNGFIGVSNSNSAIKARMYVNSSGQGVLMADIKNFVMPHPDKPGTDIYYVSLEGPEAGAYDRGVATLKNGEAFVPLSDHFKAVANASTMTVTVTSHGTNTYGLAVVEKSADGFKIKELMGGKGNFSFDWEVKCKRKGYENWRVERASSEKEALISSPETTVR